MALRLLLLALVVYYIKGIDLFLMPTPQEEHRLKMACRAARVSAPDLIAIEEAKPVTFHE